ncbi:hypothetical protein V5E97_39915 [Singulisphaera sp. Ch08]|uniref:Uncharacterized protein n=1 Tax=Singulisphaera sp. Ch08 TaxID=3120278 RepID=A0AAU7CH61_9BACT
MILNLTRALYGILGLTVKSVLLVTGAAIIVGLSFDEKNAPLLHGDAPHAKSQIVRDDRGRITVLLEHKEDEGDSFTRFILRDKEGRQLMDGQIYQDRSILFSLGDSRKSGRVRSVGYSNMSGKVCLGVWNGKSQYLLSAVEDGSSKLELVDMDTQFHRRFHVTPEGDFINDLPAD